MSKKQQFLTNVNEVANRFDCKVIEENPLIKTTIEFSAFDHPFHPIIKTDSPDILSTDFRWGLIPPDWSKQPDDIWNHTANAKLEYVAKRYAWSKVSQNRCLVPITAYYEFHWNDPKGKSKTKFIIRNSEVEIFALAGFYSKWINNNGIIFNTYAVCTTNGDKTMQFIHNKDAAKNYHRMPVMLNKEDERDWLDTSLDYMDFSYPNYKPNLIAQPFEGEPGPQLGLF